ncbi:2'-5' RNA ligase family protein [uncultured Marivirga sp.]|uniref:2'-5' RNA ligase family protein n=1 Tax=uncultured Marivirga sp. TaxID=1123707 RepID=UPI0030EB5084|tara:strand:- start:117130 stop:117678 length:549 start_codon:yes stop_codon:yes gene_type:complete
MEKSMFFIGICPPHPLEREVHGIKQEFYQKYGIKGAFRSKAHITLQMPFKLAISKEDLFLSALTQLLQNQKNFTVQLKDFGCFEPRVVFINVRDDFDLNELQKSVANFMRQFQIFNDTHRKNGFAPHITIAFRDMKKPIFYEIWSEVKDRTFQNSFLADSLIVFKHNGKAWDIFKEIKFGYT